MDGAKTILIVLVAVVIAAVGFYFTNRAKVMTEEKVDLMDNTAGTLMDGLDW